MLSSSQRHRICFIQKSFALDLQWKEGRSESSARRRRENEPASTADTHFCSEKKSSRHRKSIQTFHKSLIRLDPFRRTVFFHTMDSSIFPLLYFPLFLPRLLSYVYLRGESDIWNFIPGKGTAFAIVYCASQKKTFFSRMGLSLSLSFLLSLFFLSREKGIQFRSFL